jgi:hypothetical protein
VVDAATCLELRELFTAAVQTLISSGAVEQNIIWWVGFTDAGVGSLNNAPSNIALNIIRKRSSNSELLSVAVFGTINRALSSLSPD